MEYIGRIQVWFDELLTGLGVGEAITHILFLIGLTLIIIVLAIIADFIAKRIIISLLQLIAKRTKTDWDDILFKRKVFHRLSHLAPALIVILLAPLAYHDHPVLLKFIQSLGKIYFILIIVLVSSGFINAINDIYQNFEISRYKTIKGYLQLAKIVMYFVALIVVVSVFMGISAKLLFGGLGAIMAVLILVFKDPILGLVGSVQISMNDMIRPGDWISMPNFGADGTVIDIGLTTVKVQNFDKTIISIPTYSLISDSFQNWRGMEESEGRRIKRSININLESVKFCDEAMLAKFKEISIIREYIIEKEKELEDANKSSVGSNTVPVNIRKQTNIGVFRQYLKSYLYQHDLINNQMTCMVRQLHPTETGLPVQIYAFSKLQDWVEYEHLQSDIFDHILAVVPFFELQLFQNPSGADFQLIQSD